MESEQLKEILLRKMREYDYEERMRTYRSYCFLAKKHPKKYRIEWGRLQSGAWHFYRNLSIFSTDWHHEDNSSPVFSRK